MPYEAEGIGRRSYRLAVQGPKAWAILERLHDGPIGDIRYFTMGQIKICGRNARALKHGMAAAPGLEVRATVAPSPVAAQVREGYRPHLSGSA